MTLELVEGQQHEFSYMLHLQVSTLKQQEHPEIWVAAGEDYLEQYSFVLSALPSSGELFAQEDKSEIQVRTILL
jgi:hypothetical protein